MAQRPHAWVPSEPMSPFEVRELVRRLRAAYPDPPLSDESEKLYERMLVDLDFAAVDPVVDELIATTMKLPTVGRIRRAVIEPMLDIPTADEAWLAVQMREGTVAGLRCPRRPPGRRRLQHPHLERSRVDACPLRQGLRRAAPQGRRPCTGRRRPRATPGSFQQAWSPRPMPTVHDVLAERFGFDAFRPGQQHVVESLLAGRSALAVFPTGAGKSLCYQLPGAAARRRHRRRLAADRADEGPDRLPRRAGNRCGTARLEPRSRRGPRRLRALRAGTLKLLYVAPERFNNERFLAQLGETKIALFAVDEAHCISEWGHNFRPDYLKLAVRARELGAERVLALTATATPAVVARHLRRLRDRRGRRRRHRLLPARTYPAAPRPCARPSATSG